MIFTKQLVHHLYLQCRRLQARHAAHLRRQHHLEYRTPEEQEDLYPLHAQL